MSKMKSVIKIAEKIKRKATDLYNQSPVTIAFLGDSVTHGVFEIYPQKTGLTIPSFDAECVYHTYLKKMINDVFPGVHLNIINAGINGGNALDSLERLDRDVLRFKPDLTVVCFGLNDSTRGINGIDIYKESLEAVFERLKASGSDVIFMTPNMFNTQISIHLTDENLIKYAEMFMKIQNEGIMDKYMDAARSVCMKNSIPICDCYSKWKKLYEWGADVTGLLSNYLNHPNRQMHYLFASSLFETIFFDK